MNDISEKKGLEIIEKKEIDINKLDRPKLEKENFTPLNDVRREEISKELGFSKEIVDNIETEEQYEIYKSADLTEGEINGKKSLMQEIDPNYIDKKTGLTNLERMKKGLSPIDGKSGEKIELHHMGQKYDTSFAELKENSQHTGKDVNKILHLSNSESWRNDKDLKNKYNKVDKPNYWKERAKEF